MLLLLFVFDIAAVIQYWPIFLAVIAALYAWKAGIPQKLFSSSQSLIVLRTTERDDALKDKNNLEQEIKELKEENRLLRRECTQRMEINMQDQLTIRELKEKIGRSSV